MGRAKKKRIAKMQSKIARRAKRRYSFTPDPLLAFSLPDEPGVIRVKAVFAGTLIEGKITLP